MAIEKVQEERKAKFDELAKDIMECKAHIKDVQAYMAEKEDELLKLYSAVDPTSDYEGNESMASEKYQVSFVYKLTKKVDKEEADSQLKALGKRPEELFNVKYDYSATIFKILDEKSREAVLESLVTKRAKTTIEIKPIEAKEN